MLDVGVVIPQLAKYGGAERLVVECLSRWQHKHNITVYAEDFNRAMLEEHGIGGNIVLKRLSPQVSDNAFTFLLNSTFTPKLWSGEIGRHDIYNTHLWPLHLLDVEPAVWYPHEPLRMLYDLRADKDIVSLTTDEERRVHIYPKYTYDNVGQSLFQPMLRAAEAFDRTGCPWRIIANSAYCASYIESVYGRKADRVVYPGVTPGDFLPPMANEYILTVAQLWPHKRINLILQSLRLMDDIHLYVVGNGPEKEHLVSQAKELGIYDRTFFLSGLTNHELQIVFSRALAVVFMPIREPFGIVALEAMAASKPLVAVNEGGYVEVVDNECSFLIPPHADALAEKVNWLRSHPTEAAAMGKHGHDLCLSYSWDRTASELLDEIESAHAEWQKRNSIHVSVEQKKPLIGAQYYGWYGNGFGEAHWNDSKDYGIVTEMPSLGYYSSTSGDILEQHLRMAQEAGLDFFVFNLHVNNYGVSSNELQALSIMLDRAKYINSPIKIGVQLCLYDCLEADLHNICERLHEKVFSHPAYLHFNTSPLLSIFWTGQYDGDVAFIELLKKHTRPAFLLASSLRMYPPQEENRLTFNLFDAWSLYSPLELCAPDKWRTIWTEAYMYSDSGSRGTRCFTVSPGYNDTALSSSVRRGNPYRKIQRREGETYRLMWETAYSLPAEPDIIIVSTFNEFHENTYIEPTVKDGQFYLSLTRELADKARERWKK